MENFEEALYSEYLSALRLLILDRSVSGFQAYTDILQKSVAPFSNR
jgi:hypothetical protein